MKTHQETFIALFGFFLKKNLQEESPSDLMINASYTPVFKDERFSMPNLDATSQTLKLTINFKWLLMISYADYQENQTDSPFLIQLPIHQTPYPYTYPPP